MPAPYQKSIPEGERGIKWGKIIPIENDDNGTEYTSPAPIYRGTLSKIKKLQGKDSRFGEGIM
jgi:hypothetical protein